MMVYVGRCEITGCVQELPEYSLRSVTQCEALICQLGTNGRHMKSWGGDCATESDT